VPNLSRPDHYFQSYEPQNEVASFFWPTLYVEVKRRVKTSAIYDMLKMRAV